MLVKKIKSKSNITMTLSRQQSKDGIWSVRTTTRYGDHVHIDIQRIHPSYAWMLDKAIADGIKNLDDSLAYWDKPKDEK